MGAEKMYLAGEWTDSENGEVSDAINPATGEVLATVPKATMNDVCLLYTSPSPRD